MIAPARQVATRVLFRVAERGAWTAPALDAEIGRARMDRRDAALATAIVYDTLRVVPVLDAALAAHLRQPGTSLDGLVRAALRVGAYQLLHLSRVPAHAVVADAVEIVSRERSRQLGGLVNAVLRKVAKQRPELPEPPQTIAVPPWLEGRLTPSLGPERARAFLVARQLPPPIGLRVRAGLSRASVLDRIRAARPEARIEPGTLSPAALLVRGAGDPRRLPGYAEGALSVQEQGAQVIGLLVGAQPGERVADACAGRGGKTSQLAEAVGQGGHVTAIDVNEPKLEHVFEDLDRLGINRERVDVEAVDLTVGVAGLAGSFDRVLVDAPCTGLGTVHRRPELLLRLGPDDPARVAELQLAIASRAASLVRPGGLIVYAVCSPTREEGIGVVERVSAAVGDLEPAPEPWPLEGIASDPDGMVRLGPWAGDADAYQIWRWRRRSSPGR